MVTQEEKQHLVALNNGDLESFTWIYDRYHARVYRFCLSFVKNKQDAEEITADVFVKLWEKRSLVKAAQSIGPLLFKISRDLTWNFLRKVGRKRSLREAFIYTVTGIMKNDSENRLIFHEYMHILEVAVEALPPQQQKVFNLRYVQEMNLNQIAEELKLSKNTVKVHLNHAKKAVMMRLPINAEVSLRSVICFIIYTTLC